MTDNPENDNESQSCGCATRDVPRRAVLQGLAAVGGVVAAGPILAQDDGASMPPQEGDFLTTKSDGTPLKVGDLRENVSPVTAYAVSPDGVIRNADFMNTLMVARFSEDNLSEEAKATAVQGVLVYSSICTHAGCEVTDWVREEMSMACPCHGSWFDPKDNGSVVYGPASRKLPQLEVSAADDGLLTVVSGFDSRVGGDETM